MKVYVRDDNEMQYSYQGWHMKIILNMLHYGIVMRQLMKRYLRTTATVMKIRERLLRRTCFEIRKNKSDFYVSTICGRFE